MVPDRHVFVNCHYLGSDSPVPYFTSVRPDQVGLGHYAVILYKQRCVCVFVCDYVYVCLFLFFSLFIFILVSPSSTAAYLIILFHFEIKFYLWVNTSIVKWIIFPVFFFPTIYHDNNVKYVRLKSDSIFRCFEMSNTSRQPFPKFCPYFCLYSVLPLKP